MIDAQGSGRDARGSWRSAIDRFVNRDGSRARRGAQDGIVAGSGGLEPRTVRHKKFTERSMADMNRGLDLSVFETTTDSESAQFRSFYAEKLGTPHRGLNFWLDVDRPDLLKRYRAYADDGTPGGLETVRKVGGF